VAFVVGEKPSNLTNNNIIEHVQIGVVWLLDNAFKLITV